MFFLSTKKNQCLIVYAFLLLFLFKPILMFSFHLIITLPSVNNN